MSGLLQRCGPGDRRLVRCASGDHRLKRCVSGCCCMPDGTCVDLSMADCITAGGVFWPEECADCPVFCPTMPPAGDCAVPYPIAAFGPMNGRPVAAVVNYASSFNSLSTYPISCTIGGHVVHDTKYMQIGGTDIAGSRVLTLGNDGLNACAGQWSQEIVGGAMDIWADVCPGNNSHTELHNYVNMGVAVFSCVGGFVLNVGYSASVHYAANGIGLCGLSCAADWGYPVSGYVCGRTVTADHELTGWTESATAEDSSATACYSLGTGGTIAISARIIWGPP